MTAASTSTLELADLHGCVENLREQVAACVLPLDLPDARQAQTGRLQLLHQLDDYILPRLASIDAPLLAVVGGSTGAGKSTLVNSLVGAVVSRPGVLRPTTRSPVLVHHPADEAWFTGDRVLAGLGRVSGADPAQDPSSVRLVASDALPPGVALLDAPDIDSVVHSNRELADQLLSAADLWLFVTTAARYADAVPWALLRQASERGTSVAVVLDRVPPEAVEEVRPHLVSMLKEQGLGLAPVFTVPETTLGPDGLLGPDQIGRLHAWLSALARDAKARAIVVRQTLTGALDSLDPRTDALVEATAAQLQATKALLSARRHGIRGRRRRGPHGHHRRHLAARRGAVPLAGVRRHRGVLQAGRVGRGAHPRPARAPWSRASPPRGGISARPSTRAWPRW